MDGEPDYSHLSGAIKKLAIRVIIDAEQESPSYPDDPGREAAEYEAVVIGVAGEIVVSFAETLVKAGRRESAKDFVGSFVSRLMGHLGRMLDMDFTTIVTNNPEKFGLGGRRG